MKKIAISFLVAAVLSAQPAICGVVAGGPTQDQVWCVGYFFDQVVDYFATMFG